MPHDPNRPTVHIAPRQGWLNDPHGLIRWNGRTHLFFQSNPTSAAWGPPEWAHMVSDDLMHWTQLHAALTPAMPPADDAGCWTGSIVPVDGEPWLYYSAARNVPSAPRLQAIGLARPLDDDLVTWQKHPGNPLFGPPASPEVTRGDFRDPWVWPVEDGYRMLVGASLENRGAALVYASEDGVSWRYLHPLMDAAAAYAIDPDAIMWEVPVLRSNGAYDLLVLGSMHEHERTRTLVIVGHYRNDRFEPVATYRVDHADSCFYAAQPLVGDERLVLMGWLREHRSHEANVAAGWAGVLSLPLHVTLEGTEPRYAFATEVQGLEGPRRDYEVTLEGHGSVHLDAPVPPRGAAAMRATMTFRSDAADRITIDLLEATTGNAAATLTLDWVAREVRLDKHATAHARPDSASTLAAHAAMATAVEVDLVVDGSVVEIIVDRRVFLASRIYPRGGTAAALRLTGSRGATYVDGAITHLRPRNGAPDVVTQSSSAT